MPARYRSGWGVLGVNITKVGTLGVVSLLLTFVVAVNGDRPSCVQPLRAGMMSSPLRHANGMILAYLSWVW